MLLFNQNFVNSKTLSSVEKNITSFYLQTQENTILDKPSLPTTFKFLGKKNAFMKQLSISSKNPVAEIDFKHSQQPSPGLDLEIKIAQSDKCGASKPMIPATSSSEGQSTEIFSKIISEVNKLKKLRMKKRGDVDKKKIKREEEIMKQVQDQIKAEEAADQTESMDKSSDQAKPQKAEVGVQIELADLKIEDFVKEEPQKFQKVTQTDPKGELKEEGT